ncbi:nuclear factor related to kappa-B-binding protein [Chanos chanos]|uniref:Nuclear factor related to kappa-B-binding protein n=1 Tax=Chanos chanos TaxID=29144 RepID=A0A6J2VX04_CHACN|nr:nuclear factor related to kappa-B-binding protein [Chanos chanos]
MEDALNHMLTDPLDSGMSSDGRIMEECMLGNCRIRLPEDLLEDPEIFFSVLSESTWSEVLTDAQRQRLRQHLPHFPENNESEQDRIISDLFNNQNFCFGNPLHLAQKLFRDGYFNPEVVKYRQLFAKSQKKRCLYSLQQYYHKLLKQILVSRKELLDLAVRSGPELMAKRRYPPPSHKELQEQRVRLRVSRILREVKNECGDSTALSDEDETGPWLPAPQSPPSPTPTISLRVLPSLSTQDMKTRDKMELGEKEMRDMLRRHREKRKLQPDHPDLMTSDLHLGDIMSRVNIGRKGSMLALFDLALPKKKLREEKRRKKMRPIKVETDDFGDAQVPNASAATGLTDSQAPPLPSVKEEPMEESHNSPDTVEEITGSFFNLLEDILRVDCLATTSTIEDKVQQWQAASASTLNPWYSLSPCWSELVLQGLQFLSGESKPGVMALPSGFTPFVEFRELSQQWKWIGPSQDAEKDLSALCQLWLESKDHVVVKQEGEEPAELTPPTPRVWTDYVVRPSTGEERHVFQEQEQQRYDQPHKAFTYRMHGFESVVGPVKGVFDKETSLNKAREHSLLRSDRPPYVTILSLVRDAAARLPNGEGTRAEICELLKDSQFLASDVTSAQVNTVVSGALDRLHYEKDPCVKYDIGRKLWIYLHRDRSQEEFERIHQAQAAAAKARKALQQKPKPSPKPKSGNKEAGGKTSGGGESGQGTGNEGVATSASTTLPQTPITPTPSTPGTPKSPLAPTVTTPTKAGLPDPVKSNPSILLVSPPSMPQLGALSAGQSAPQACQSASVTTAARAVAHSTSGSLPQVRVVTSQPPAQQTALLQQSPQHIRVPVTMAHAKSLTQAVVTLPLRAQSVGSPIQVQATRGQTGLTVSSLGSAVTVTKAQTSPATPGSPAHTPPSQAVVQGVSSPSIIKQVAITGQLGVKAQGGAGIPLTATNLRIQGKDVLRLPPSSITTDAKGQTVLRITPDMMATLTKSPVATVKLTPDMLGAATTGATGTKSISATLHVTPPHPSLPTSSNPAVSAIVTETKATSSLGTAMGTAATLVKVQPELKAACDTTIRLMPALAVTVADPKARSFSTVTSTDSKAGTTIRIMPGLGVIPQKQGQAVTTAAAATTTKPATASSGAATVTIATSGVVGAKGVTIRPPAAGSAITLGTGATTVRQVPVSATVVASQPGKLPARITVPLSVLSQPLKNKSVVTTPILKGNIGTNISSLGRNIILTTMPAGTKLIAGNKPVSFVTAQQLQQLQQQGQATQVRIQTVPAQQLQQRTTASSPKSVSTVVVTTAPSPKRTPDPQ